MFNVSTHEQESFNTNDDANYHIALCKTLFALFSGCRTKATGSASSPLPYAVASPFVPLVRSIICSPSLRSLTPQDDDSETRPRNHVYAVMCSLFECGSSDACNARRHIDLVDFVASTDFDPMLDLGDANSFQRLHKFLNMLNDDMFVRAFSDERVERFLRNIRPNEHYPLERLSLFMDIFKTLTTRLPEFAQKGLWTDGLRHIVGSIKEVFEDRHLKSYNLLPSNTIQVFENILSTSTDALHAGLQLLASGAVSVCCTFLLRFLLARRATEEALGNVWPNTVQLAQILRFLRVLVSTSDTSPGSDGCSTTSRNPFVVEFITHRGPQALELLRFDNCLQWHDSDTVSL